MAAVEVFLHCTIEVFLHYTVKGVFHCTVVGAHSLHGHTQQLVSNVGYNVAQAGTDSMGAKEIQELIEHDIPQVSGHAMACTLSPNHFCWSTSILLVFSSWILQSFYSFHIALYCKNFIRLLLPALTLYIRG